MAQWYFSYNGERSGPFDDAAAQAQAQRQPVGHCWKEGFAAWKPIDEVPELAASARAGTAGAGMPPPAPVANEHADEVEYRIVGNDMQFVEVTLDPGESAIGEAGAMMYKDACVEMDSVFGDASKNDSSSNLMGKLMSAGKRYVTGASLFTTVFTHKGQGGKAQVSFAAPYPGTVMAMNLTEHGGCLICQKDSFLAGARGVTLGIFLQKKILTGLFGGEGFVMQKLEGDGWVFVHAGGTMVERELAAGERIDVDTGCVVAFHKTVSMDVRSAGSVQSMFFGGEGMFLATLTGPGKVWLQSLPFSRMAGRMLAAAPQGGGKNRGEGSVLGGLGRLLDGDSNF